MHSYPRDMELHRLNYNHLRCFWAVAREGGVTAAGKLLQLTQPTISKQVGELEEALGQPLFLRRGRRLVLTDVGRTVFAYAEDIFTLGQEMMDALRGHATADRPMRLVVGASDALPKLLTRMAIAPALALPHAVRLLCREGKTNDLLADLVLTGLDVVLTDAPLPDGSRFKAFSHLLGESSLTVFGVAELAKRHRGDFPRSLNAAPVLLPTPNTAIRRSIDAWLDEAQIRPNIVGEFEDSAVLKSFGAEGHGLFFAASVIEASIAAQYAVEPLGTVEEVRESLYAVTAERRIRHPGVEAIIESSRTRLGAGRLSAH